MEDKLIEKALGQIKAENIKPKPRWELLAYNVSKWALFGVCGLVGAVAFVYIFNVLAGADWDVHPRLGLGIFRFAILAVPPFWVVFLLSALVLAYVAVRSTRHGYRYETKHVIVMILGLVMITGIASFFMRADDFLERRMPPMFLGYDRAKQMQKQVWSNPEKGLLGGTVITFDDGSRIILLRDFQGQDWRVEFDQQTNFSVPAEKRIIGKRLKVLGETRGELRFRAFMIRPWNDRIERRTEREPGRPMMMRPHVLLEI